MATEAPPSGATTPAEGPSRAVRRDAPVGRVWLEYGRAVAVVAGATAVASAARAVLHVPDVEMLFLLGVMIVAVTSGRGASVAASVLSVASYDFFFVPPPWTFEVEDARYVLTFVMMLGVAVVISTLALRVREQERAAAALALERVRLADEARRAALRAETEELRSALLSSVSHDLRTPLSAITGAATALRDDVDLDHQTRRDLVESVCEEAERLERLVANLLDMTRLESGAVQPRREWVPLIEVIGGALNRLDRQLAGREVTTALPDDLPLLNVDPVLIEQLFLNLLENAGKHTPPGSPIAVAARSDAASVVVEIADRGPGIAQGAEELVFERFRRGAGASHGGAGLGLAIARAIAVAHGGTLVASRRAGGGAVFRLSLPSGKPPESAPEDSP